LPRRSSRSWDFTYVGPWRGSARHSDTNWRTSGTWVGGPGPCGDQEGAGVQARRGRSLPLSRDCALRSSDRRAGGRRQARPALSPALRPDPVLASPWRDPGSGHPAAMPEGSGLETVRRDLPRPFCSTMWVGRADRRHLCGGHGLQGSSRGWPSLLSCRALRQIIQDVCLLMFAGGAGPRPGRVRGGRRAPPITASSTSLHLQLVTIPDRHGRRRSDRTTEIRHPQRCRWR
jgi:hypothetical protein